MEPSTDLKVVVTGGNTNIAKNPFTAKFENSKITECQKKDQISSAALNPQKIEPTEIEEESISSPQNLLQQAALLRKQRMEQREKQQKEVKQQS